MAKIFMLKIFLIIASIALYSPSYSMNIISRANCGNNESITWDPWQTRYPFIQATSYHNWTGGGDNHVVNDSRYNDNAAKAIHWGEGFGMLGGSFWIVSGYHRWGNAATGANYFASSYATFCVPE